ncbi:ribbon-helix-helix protein, CopG family [Promicromonospora sp. NPDC090134]|uniref:ribbon-helix-helix protein, CopG family n=1 Tax=Promicromonospora sp. NPDC090134 TaxID=3364408 RepID=UPI003815E18A
MMKTSIYLDEERKAALERVGALTGRSQADLIREGIDQVIHDHLRTRPKMKGRLRQHGLTRRVDELLDGFGE